MYILLYINITTVNIHHICTIVMDFFLLQNSLVYEQLKSIHSWNDLKYFDKVLVEKNWYISIVFLLKVNSFDFSFYTVIRFGTSVRSSDQLRITHLVFTLLFYVIYFNFLTRFDDIIRVRSFILLYYQIMNIV